MIRRRLVLVAAGVVATVSAAHAQQTGFGQSFTTPGNPNTVLQQLTVAPTGIFGVSPSGSFVVDIFTLNGTTPTGASLFTQALGPKFAGLTLSPNIPLPGGLSSVFVMQTPDPASRLTANTPADSYAGGGFLICNAGSPTCFQASAQDLEGFTVTFGPAPTAVPEPVALALVAGGLLVLGGVVRRRRSVRANA